MRNIHVLTVVAMGLLAGCSSISKELSLSFARGPSKEEKRAENDRIMAEWEAEAQVKREQAAQESAAYRIGATEKEFRDAFGEPHDVIEQTEAKTVTRFYIHTEPTIVIFQRGKVTGIGEDSAEKARQIASQNVRAQQDRNAVLGQGVKALRQGLMRMNMPRTTTTHCTPTYGGGVRCTSN